MPDYRNAEGSTGYLKEGKFVPFASQEEADGETSSEQEEAAPAKSARTRKPADEEK